LIILNGVASANSLNYVWYVCVFDKYLWIIGLLIFLPLFWIIVELRYSLSCFEHYARSNILNTDSSRSWENKLSSTERSDLGDDFCRSLFFLFPLDICCPSVFDLWILITSLVSSNSSYISKVRTPRSGIGDFSQVWHYPD
jgi:hypothetical protein